MSDVDMFLDVYSDLRFPLIAVDLEKLRRAMQQRAQNGLASHFGVELTGSPERRRALVSALSGLFRKIDMSSQAIDFLARFEAFARAGLSQDIEALKAARKRGVIYEQGNKLVWEDEMPWPFAFSTLLLQVTNVMTLHRMLMEHRVKEVQSQHLEAGWAVENVAGVVSEFPRQLPTHLHYAMASLGAWLGGAINVQYFAYYAAIRQIFHPHLNRGSSRPKSMVHSPWRVERIDYSGWRLCRREAS